METRDHVPSLVRYPHTFSCLNRIPYASAHQWFVAPPSDLRARFLVCFQVAKIGIFGSAEFIVVTSVTCRMCIRFTASTTPVCQPTLDGCFQRVRLYCGPIGHARRPTASPSSQQPPVRASSRLAGIAEF